MAAHYRNVAPSSDTAVRLHLDSRSINANVPSPGKLILFVFTVLVNNPDRKRAVWMAYKISNAPP